MDFSGPKNILLEKGNTDGPTGTNPKKKALELSDIKKIYDYQPQTLIETEMYARSISGYLAITVMELT